MNIRNSPCPRLAGDYYTRSHGPNPRQPLPSLGGHGGESILAFFLTESSDDQMQHDRIWLPRNSTPHLLILVPFLLL
ncbi:hypothetical protein NL676_007329 [Syzygium grande]|nr:hypothetical protein NL676_007329 [Syzygium grande]